MKNLAKLATTVMLGLSVAVPAAFAQGDGTDEAAVWAVVERQWRAERQGDDRWVDELLSADFVGWPRESPAPRNRTSTRLWAEFNSRQSETLEYELYPLSILVHDNMAVAHYLFTTATRAGDSEVEVRNGRYTDVLVRIDTEWKFISWHGGYHD